MAQPPPLPTGQLSESIPQMSPTPPASNHSSAHSPNTGPTPDAQHRVVRKRNRVPLSCAACRHRKLKCNRAAPCDNCVKRGDTNGCSYASPPARRRATTTATTEASTPVEMQSRINRLENLVLSLMGSGSPATAAAALAAGENSSNSSESTQITPSKDDSIASDDADLENVSRSIGVLKVANDRQFYASEGHWWTILSDIAEVKRYFLEHQKEYDEQMDKVKASKIGEPSAAVSLLFRGSATADRSTLLANFPPKSVVDGLMQRHFNTEGNLLHILHGATFRRQYDRHWQNSNETPIPWLGMCYSIMSLALESYHRSGDEPQDFRGTSRDYAIKYAECAAQCLVTADFTQPLNFMLEALCFYFQAEYSRSRDAETGLWMLSGIISRLAMRMGLQRDSAPYAIMSPYQGEMRRRIWAYIRTIDIQLSFQCGLPNMIRSTDCDTALPSNLYDEDFDEDTGPLPPPRPLSEKTAMSFMIAHTKIVWILGRIQELSMSLKFPSYEETMKLDARLRENMAELPEFLRIRSVEHSSLDPAMIKMQRYALDLLYHKCLLLLHRKFLPAARREARYLTSRKTCIDSCLEMLAHQSTLQLECQPGASLSSLAWSFTTSLTTHDFLLAAMVVCLDLYHTAQAEASGRTSGEGYKWALETREAMYAAIERTVQIWSTLRDQSLEAYKASTILRVMLEKLRDHQELRQQLQKNFSFETRNDGVAPDGLVASERSAALTLGMLSSGARIDGDPQSVFDSRHTTAQRNMTPLPNTNPQPSAPGIDGMFNWPNTMAGPNLGGFSSFGDVDMAGANIDWAQWDYYIQGLGLAEGSGTGASSNVFDQSYLADGDIVASSTNNVNGKVTAPGQANGYIATPMQFST